MIPGQFSDIPAATSDDIGSPDVYIAQRIEQREPIAFRQEVFCCAAERHALCGRLFDALLLQIGGGLGQAAVGQALA